MEKLDAGGAGRRTWSPVSNYETGSRRDWKLEIVLSAPDQWKAWCWNWLIYGVSSQTDLSPDELALTAAQQAELDHRLETLDEERRVGLT